MNPLEIQAISLFESVAKRFIKGGLSGAAATLAVITITTPQTWSSLNMALIALMYAAITGFVAGGIMAVEKWLNWTDTPSA